MATSSDGGGGDQRRLLSIPKEGERIIAPTRRPDGTLRKAIRIRAGYVPQEEVAIYQSKGALMRKSGPDVPPGYDPALAVDAKPKTKAAKRNERRKEKRQQQASSTNDKGKGLDIEDAGAAEIDKVLSSKADKQRDSVESVTKQIRGIAISESSAAPSTNANDSSQPESSAPDIDKKIRALKKKIRLAEAQLQGDPKKLKSETQEKLKKIEGWRAELKLLEDKKAPTGS
ncbi:partner of Y14 and mago-like isoform X1 [Panicum virgatum]|uniref:partner of Y14 and mago-like isoform X1 n=1 Tax=Panicum virgatum TaxID=38727 RepID=UPI0019D5E594|nr:partner of Y14 and mago-like isoform X1 [Panicum virgatum]